MRGSEVDLTVSEVVNGADVPRSGAWVSKDTVFKITVEVVEMAAWCPGRADQIPPFT